MGIYEVCGWETEEKVASAKVHLSRSEENLDSQALPPYHVRVGVFLLVTTSNSQAG